MVSYWLLLLFLSACVQADYSIDDQDPSVIYSPNNLWSHKSSTTLNNSVDITECYNQTFTENNRPCRTTDFCTFRMSFTGSGIALFGILSSTNPLGAEVTLDGNQTTAVSFSNLSTNGFRYNQLIYLAQYLANTQHTLTVALIDYSPYDNDTVVGSLIQFDYADVITSNSTAISSSASSTASSPASESNDRPHSTSRIIGPVVGGVVGGVALSIIIALLLKSRVKRSSNHVSNIDSEPKPFVDLRNGSSGYGSGGLPTQSYAYSGTSSTNLPDNAVSVASFEPHRHHSDRSQSGAAPLPSSRQHPSVAAFNGYLTKSSLPPVPDSSSQSTSIPPSLLPPDAEPRQITTVNPGTNSTSPSRPLPPVSGHQSEPNTNAAVAASNSSMTEEELRFVADLYNNNVPAVEVARLMELMRRGRANGALLGDDEGSNSNGATSEEPPPSYDS